MLTFQLFCSIKTHAHAHKILKFIYIYINIYVYVSVNFPKNVHILLQQNMLKTVFNADVCHLVEAHQITCKRICVFFNKSFKIFLSI